MPTRLLSIELLWAVCYYTKHWQSDLTQARQQAFLEHLHCVVRKFYILLLTECSAIDKELTFISWCYVPVWVIKYKHNLMHIGVKSHQTGVRDDPVSQKDLVQLKITYRVAVRRYLSYLDMWLLIYQMFHMQIGKGFYTWILPSLLFPFRMGVTKKSVYLAWGA